MGDPDVIYEVHSNHVAILRLNRCRAKNAFNKDLYISCLQRLKEAEADASVAAVIITGAGDYFSSGADIKELQQLHVPNSQAVSIADQPAGLFMKAVVHFRKLLVAAVNGPAVGIGVTMLPHCDLVVCAQKATFWTPFGRLAIVPELCSSVTFPELMGYSKATEMLVLGQKLSAKEALQAKLVSRIYPSEGFLEQVESSLVQSLLSLPFGQQSALHYKQTMLAARLPRMEAALATEFVELDKRLRSGAPQAALRALGAPGGTQSRL